MKRWQAQSFGEPREVLQQVEVPLPEPGTTEACVRVLTASVALPDLMIVRGTYPLVPSPPASPGQEVLGVVEAAGTGFPFSPGTRIVGNAHVDVGAGGLAEFALVPAAGAMPVPEGLSDEQAVGFTGSFCVAHIGLHHRAHLVPGETLLVLGGAGRTGSAALQLGKAMGATVIATARTADAGRFCSDQGADHVIDLSRQPLTETVRTLTGGRGADVIYDTVGGPTYTEATEAIAPSGGRVLLVGFASGQMAQPDARSMLFRDYSVTGVLSAFRTAAEQDQSMAALSTMVRDGHITPPVTDTYDFDAVPAAIAARGTGATGQTVVRVAARRG